jgi:hypothetical protein
MIEKLLEMACFSPPIFVLKVGKLQKNDKEKISNCWRCSRSILMANGDLYDISTLYSLKWQAVIYISVGERRVFNFGIAKILATTEITEFCKIWLKFFRD